LFPAFVERAMPFLESKLPAPPKRRYLWGMSQGGLNASELLLRKPELWAAAAFSCPAWYTIGVFSSSQAVAGYTSRNRADRGTVDWGLGLIRDRVAGAEEWEREDPLARALAPAALPPVYIDCTRGDQFGFFEGATLMAERLRKAGRRVTFREEKGRHCQLDARAVAAFLAEAAQRPPEAIDGGPAAIR
jgi:pimeloyl-ACP methyl ester carboxylesterase